MKFVRRVRILVKLLAKACICNCNLATSIHTCLNNFRQFLDPRRPSVTTPPEMREPGLPPYVPELVFPPEVILNYNQTLTRVQGISKLNFLFRNFIFRSLSPKV